MRKAKLLKAQDPALTNMHNRHIASCLCCNHLCGDMGDEGYSEYTPGYPGVIECRKGLFRFSSGNSWREVLSILHDTGAHCKKFEPTEDDDA